MQAKREAFVRDHRLIHRADPDFPITQALQQRLLAEERISREAVPRPAPAARSPDAALPAAGLRTMADFRRALAIPGVQVVRLDTPEPTRRTVAALLALLSNFGFCGTFRAVG